MTVNPKLLEAIRLIQDNLIENFAINDCLDQEYMCPDCKATELNKLLTWLKRLYE